MEKCGKSKSEQNNRKIFCSLNMHFTYVISFCISFNEFSPFSRTPNSTFFILTLNDFFCRSPRKPLYSVVKRLPNLCVDQFEA